MLQLSSYKYVNAGFVVVTLIFLIGCTSSNSWRQVYYDDSKDYSTNGLWRVCSASESVKECGQYYPGGWIDASRTLMILSILFTAGAVVYTFGAYITINDPVEMKLHRAAILLGIAAFFIMVGMAVYTANETIEELQNAEAERGYAFTIGWASFVLELISIFTSLVADRR